MSQIINLKNLSLNDIEDIDKNKAVAFIVVSPFEVHGYHLPLGQDILMAETMMYSVVKLLKKKNVKCYKYPTLAIGSHVLYGDGFQISPFLLRKVVVNVIKVLKLFEFKNLVICNAHGGPFHDMVLSSAKKFAERNGLKCFSAFHIFLKNGLNEELEKSKIDLRTDLHAGLLETSIALAAYPDKVDSDYKNYKFPNLNLSIFEKLIIKYIIPLIYPILRALGFYFDKKTLSLFINHHIEKRKPPYIGYPNRASKEKGKFFLKQMDAYFKREIVDKIV